MNIKFTDTITSVATQPFTATNSRLEIKNIIIHEYHIHPVFGNGFNIPVFAEITTEKTLQLPRADLIKSATVTFFADNTGKFWLNNQYLLSSTFDYQSTKIDKTFFKKGENFLKFYCHDTNLEQSSLNSWYVDLVIKFDY